MLIDGSFLMRYLKFIALKIPLPKNIIHFYSTILAIVFLTFYSNSQGLSKFEVTEITVNSGLPSNETYKVLEDQVGYIWIATDYGLSKFDGNKHFIFNSTNGLPTNSVYHLFLEKDTSITGICSSGDFFNIKNNQVKILFHPDTLKKLEMATRMAYSFVKDQYDNYHIGTRRGYFKLNNKSEIQDVDTLFGAYNRINLKEFNNEIGQLFNYRLPSNESADSVNLFDNNLNKYTVVIDSGYRFFNSVYGYKNHSISVLPVSNKIAIYNKDSHLIPTLINVDAYCLSVFIDGEYIFANTKSGGTKCFYYSNEEIKLAFTLFEDLSVSSICKTSDGRFFFSTLEEGIKIIDTKSPSVEYAKDIKSNITSFCRLENQLYIGFENGTIVKDNKVICQKDLQKVYSIRAINDCIYFGKGMVYFMDSTGNLKPFLNTSLRERFQSAKFVQALNDSMYALVGTANIVIMEVNDNLPQAVKYIDKFVYNSKVFILQNRVIISSDKDLVVKNINLSKNENNYSLTSKIVYVFELNNLILGITEDWKICQIGNNNLNFYRLPNPQEKVLVTTAYYYRGYLCIATNEGLYTWVMHDNALNMVDYEPIDFIENIAAEGDYFYFMNSDKIYKKSINFFEKNLPKPYLVKIKVNNVEIAEKEEFLLPYNENNLEFEFSSLSTRKVKYYKYKLLGHDRKYFFSENGAIFYSAIHPGEYYLCLSSTTDGINYSKEKKIKIVILNPFWKQLWFIILLCTTGILMVLGFVKIRFNKLQKEMEIRNTIATLKSQALTAQLNPHLVFNILNSIQGLVSDGEDELANIYISRFSRYLRSSLEVLKVSLISLEEELKMVEYYLELEKMRFPQSFDFTIIKSAGSTSVMVPPLILQPIMENVIKHGFTSINNHSGKLTIQVQEINEQIEIIIEDNGDGFEENYQENSGIQITRDRLLAHSLKNEFNILSKRNPTVVQIIFKK